MDPSTGIVVSTFDGQALEVLTGLAFAVVLVGAVLVTFLAALVVIGMRR